MNEDINKYEQINLITFFAMIMISSQHFVIYFIGDISFVGSNLVLNFIEGISRAAVDLFVINIGYSNLYRNKSVKFDRVLLYIIVPTILLTAINNYAFDVGGVTFNLSGGFLGSWFGDMYIGLMFFVPLIMYHLSKNQKLTFLIGLIIWAFAFVLSVYQHENKLDNLGVLVSLPYIGMLISYTYFCLYIKPAPKTIAWLLFIIATIIETLAYLEIFPSTIIQSYFSPITFLQAYSFFIIIYESNWKIPNLRKLTRSSYFYYFTSYTVIKFFDHGRQTFVGEFPLISYLLVVFGGMVLSYTFYVIYSKILDIMKLNLKAQSTIIQK